MEVSTNWCSGFTDNWYQWYLGKWYVPMARSVYIGDECEKHDNIGGSGCSATAFAKGLWDKKVVGGSIIFTVATIACFILYTKEEFKGI